MSIRALSIFPRRGPKQIRDETARIGRELVRTSSRIDDPDFTVMHRDDLAWLFDVYDECFLAGYCRRSLGNSRLRFRPSGRMTKAGGKTTRLTRADGSVDYEIVVSSFILFDGFAPGDPDVTVCGLPCRTRLEALQRVMEHEIVHLVELIHAGKSNCRAKPFQELAERLFLHRSHTHELITRVERAAREGIVPGTPVSFSFQGTRLTGRVNRITKRATVLVRNPSGVRYSDGHRYEKYYVPLGALKKENK